MVCVIIHPSWDQSKSMLVKEAPDIHISSYKSFDTTQTRIVHSVYVLMCFHEMFFW